MKSRTRLHAIAWGILFFSSDELERTDKFLL